MPDFKNNNLPKRCCIHINLLHISIENFVNIVIAFVELLAGMHWQKGWESPFAMYLGYLANYIICLFLALLETPLQNSEKSCHLGNVSHSVVLDCRQTELSYLYVMY